MTDYSYSAGREALRALIPHTEIKPAGAQFFNAPFPSLHQAHETDHSRALWTTRVGKAVQNAAQTFQLSAEIRFETRQLRQFKSATLLVTTAFLILFPSAVAGLIYRSGDLGLLEYLVYYAGFGSALVLGSSIALRGAPRQEPNTPERLRTGFHAFARNFNSTTRRSLIELANHDILDFDAPVRAQTLEWFKRSFPQTPS